MTLLHQDAINALVYGDHGAPFDVLGPHEAGSGRVTIRTFNPGAKNLYLLIEGRTRRSKMTLIHEAGLYESTIRINPDELHYQLEAEMHDGRTLRYDDPYAFPPVLSDYDLYLLGEGRHRESYTKLGAHPMEFQGVRGVHFAVWAPNAQRISVIGDFNDWDKRVHPMRLRGNSGIWELFIPGIDVGAIYKYALKSHVRGYHAEKSDPYAFWAEHRPKTASVVVDLDDYEWNDEQWMAARARWEPLKNPISIYEVHMGSWRRHDGGMWFSYREMADELVDYVREMGYTHVELMPIMEHPLDASWGYQVTGYMAPTSRFGTPQDFMYFIDRCHQAGIGVILDWVPAHFPKDGHALSFFDGTHLYSHEDPRKGEHPDWGTYIFNYGRNEVRNFLMSSALLWLKKYHIDGLRVDAVSSMVYLDFSRKDGEWLPNEYGGNENLEAVQFLQEANVIIHEEAPGAITIAEESTAWPMVSRPTYIGGLGFTFKWNMGWMHDTLDYISLDPVYRRYHHNQLTFSMMYAYTENFVLSLSHDEVVHGKGSLMGKSAGDWWQKFATQRLLFAYQYTHPGKKLNFMGSEFGQWNEWNENRSLDWHLLNYPTHVGLQRWVRDLNHFYRRESALYSQDFSPEGFQWIEPNDADQSVFTYIRRSENGSFLVIALNFTPVPRMNFRVGVPEHGHYQEVLNSDAALYGGGNVGNYGGVSAEAIPWNGFWHSLNVNIPPLGAVILKYQA